ncbi:DUF2125 domain-containing protein [Lutimaribacter marinistellae]|uniref:DUF2125 domain-containing protein n=1 Tax=Lutimaribacter marinistellae TaxID=1820329 RepID=A0ABV7TMJ2_9RHOB
MLRLVRVLLILAALWSLYWFAAAYGLRSSVSNWFAAREAEGWQADYADLATSGFPLRHLTTLTAPALADPATGTAWRADWLTFDSPAIWPGRQTLRFADTPQRLSYFDQTAVIEAQGMSAELHLAPGVALELERMALTSGPWALRQEGGPLAEAQSLTLEMVQTDDAPTYRIAASAEAFTPGDGLRRMLRPTSALPRSFETAQAEMTVTFDKPWDRTALEERRPQPQAVDLRLAELHWGELRLFATGSLSIDEQGIPTGEVAIKAENWREMLAMAQAAGALPPQAVEPAARVLGMLAGLGGNPKALDAQLNFREGFVALGPIPLGPAPRFILR